MGCTGLQERCATLGERFRDGDPDAVREIHRRYGARMMAMATGMLRDREQANDVVQQAFLQAWRSAPRFDPDRELGPWLFQITRRVVLDRLRHDRVRPRTGAALDGDRVSSAVDETDLVERAWVVWEVRRAIDALPEGERVVARLAHVEELSHREIADRLRLPIGTVKSRSARAHGRLAAALAHVAAVPA